MAPTPQIIRLPGHSEGSIAVYAKWVLPGHVAPWRSGVEAAVVAVETAARTPK